MATQRKMRKDTFAKFMNANWRYVALDDIERMSNEQRLEYKKEHNPYLVYDGVSVKLNDVVNDEGNIMEGELVWDCDLY